MLRSREDVTHVMLLALCYEDAANKVAYKYTVDSRLLLYLENTTVFMPVISFYFVVLIRHTLKAGPWKYCLTLNRSVVQKRLGTAALDNKVCEPAAAAALVLKVESMGQEQYNNFKKNVLDSHDTPLTAPIKWNNLMLFHEKKTCKKTAAKLRMQHFKHHAELNGKAFIVLESRSGNFFATSLLHTHLHYHVKDPSTPVPSQICCFTSWEILWVEEYLTMRR